VTVTLAISVDYLLWPLHHVVFPEWRSRSPTERFGRQLACTKQQGLEFKDLHLFSVLCTSAFLFQFTDMKHSNFTSICLSIDWRCVYYLIYIVLLRTTKKRRRLHIDGNAEGCFRAYEGGRYIQEDWENNIIRNLMVCTVQQIWIDRYEKGVR